MTKDNWNLETLAIHAGQTVGIQNLERYQLPRRRVMCLMTRNMPKIYFH